MLKLIPSVKGITVYDGILKTNAVFYENLDCDERILKALKTLPFDKNGSKLNIEIKGDSGEGYSLKIRENEINIVADSPAGAFYAIQTIRQLFKNGKVPTLDINDSPDFALRGFYHDITRGKVPTLETLKKLVDTMAHYKMNHLELYVEHVYEFEETKDIIDQTGYITSAELKELDAYCKENFIEFVPSLATFGHMYEILQQDKYRHLAVMDDYKPLPNFWNSRMCHHTINPMLPESEEFINSLIDQYAPNFESDYFNICGDETFDLHQKYKDTHDVGKLYFDFVKKIIAHLHEIGKTPMMWEDIAIKHPEFIEELPEDTIFLNWSYSRTPRVENIIKLSQMGRKQVVCPGTTSWSRFCEDVTEAERNISLMAEYGHKYGAIGVLNTNWGDWGNPCSIELATYGLVLGAQKSWSVERRINEDYYDTVNALVYGNDKAVDILKRISCMQHKIDWNFMCSDYFKYRYNLDWYDYRPVIWKADYEDVKERYLSLKSTLENEVFENNNFRQHMLIALEGLMVITELYCKIRNFGFERVTDTKAFLKKYREIWLADNKESELSKIEEMLLYVEEN